MYVLWVKPMILETEEQDACRSTDLIVWDDVAKLFPDITNAVEKRIQTLVGVYDNVVPCARLHDRGLRLG